MKNTIIDVRHLSKRYNGSLAVDDVSLSVQEGEIFGFLGPNGAGKTTTIQMILGLITPTSGSIRIFGKSMKNKQSFSSNNREQILNEVNFSSAYVSLPGNLKVWENLVTFARLYGVKNYRARLDELIAFFDLGPLMSKLYISLSSGQMTRVHLAKALLNRPRLLFLDEPTASLDPDIADRTRKLLKKIQKDEGLTIFYTTHNMREVDELCNRAMFIHEGKIVTEGTPAQLKGRFGLKDLNDVFLKIAREE